MKHQNLRLHRHRRVEDLLGFLLLLPRSYLLHLSMNTLYLLRQIHLTILRLSLRNQKKHSPQLRFHLHGQKKNQKKRHFLHLRLLRLSRLLCEQFPQSRQRQLQLIQCFLKQKPTAKIRLFRLHLLRHLPMLRLQ